ncbi:hypothetical protein SAMN05192543_10235 [Paraburkholderia megapolitana]|uniref:Uncharacterized protein n=1 Tax=Paraburkholderia megapolitana TaxID=420953 RepID=A0A1I3FP54_9BURK|nr:hypothetical protein SAMN05192543_10235 [Paraburkholderia megapolitana]
MSDSNEQYGEYSGAVTTPDVFNPPLARTSQQRRL